MKWPTTERRHVQRVYLWGRAGPPDRGHASHHPYGRAQEVESNGRRGQEIDTVDARRPSDVIEGLVAEGGFEPPTKGL